MHLRLALGSLLVAVCAATSFGASAAERREREEMARPGRRVVNAEDARKNAQTTLTEISWQKDLDACKAVARDEGKLIFWMHMLGDLNGFT